MNSKFLYLIWGIIVSLFVSSCGIVSKRIKSNYKPRIVNEVKYDALRQAGFELVKIESPTLVISVPSDTVSKFLVDLLNTEIESLISHEKDIEFKEFSIESLKLKEQDIELKVKIHAEFPEGSSFNKEWYAGVNSIEATLNASVTPIIKEDSLFFNPNIHSLDLSNLKIRFFKAIFRLKSLENYIEEFEKYINQAFFEGVKNDSYLAIDFKPFKNKKFSELVDQSDVVIEKDKIFNLASIKLKRTSLLVTKEALKIIAEINLEPNSNFDYSYLDIITQHPFNFYAFMLHTRFDQSVEQKYTITEFDKDGLRFHGIGLYQPKLTKPKTFHLPLLPIKYDKSQTKTDEDIKQMFKGYKAHFEYLENNFLAPGFTNSEMYVSIRKSSISRILNHLFTDLDVKVSSDFDFQGSLKERMIFNVGSISCDDSFRDYCKRKFEECVDDCDGPKIGRDVCKGICLGTGLGIGKCLINAAADISSCLGFVINDVLDLNELRIGEFRLKHETTGALKLGLKSIKLGDNLDNIKLSSDVQAEGNTTIDLSFIPRNEGWLLCNIPYNNFGKFKSKLEGRYNKPVTANINFIKGSEEVILSLVPNDLDKIPISMKPSIGQQLLTDPAFRFSCSVVYNAVLGSLILWKGTDRSFGQLGRDTELGNILYGFHFGDYVQNNLTLENIDIHLLSTTFENYTMYPHFSNKSISFSNKK